MKKYSNKDITIIWQPDKCIHSRNCFSSLGVVFDPRKRPWINPEGANTEEIIKSIDRCPSKALSYEYNNGEKVAEQEVEMGDDVKIMLTKNGPLLFEGECIIIDADGNEQHKSGKIFLCRCGASTNKPFCDGSHRKVGFEG